MVNVRHMFKSVLLEVEANNVVWCVRIVGSKDACYLLLQLFLSQLQLIVWFHQGLGL